MKKEKLKTIIRECYDEIIVENSKNMTVEEKCNEVIYIFTKIRDGYQTAPEWAKVEVNNMLDKLDIFLGRYL